MRYDMASEIEVSTKKEREMRRLSLEDIEEAYLGLMNAYSMCLASLIGMCLAPSLVPKISSRIHLDQKN
jgi:hypothetical protein